MTRRIETNERVAQWGQVFTRQDIVKQLLALRRNTGRTLEPSAGDGQISQHLNDCVAIELDATIAPPGALVMDFMAYPIKEKFSSIVGNPPYVRHQDILPETKKLLNDEMFDARSNLYLHFIAKCIRHLKPGGELILITPRDFIKMTGARKMNAWLYSQGTITDFIETGDAHIFGAYVPNCAIFRFEKGRTDRRMSDGRLFQESNGQLLFLRNTYTVPFSDCFDVKVGAVSGADEIFIHPEGNFEFVCSTTAEEGGTRRAFYNVRNPYLEHHRELLIARKVKKFDETNWWMWGRHQYQTDRPRIYVNAKTRRAEPFFLHECSNFDGSILALFPKNPYVDLERLVFLLNTNVDWADLGFVCDGRFMFAQGSLQTCSLPAVFSEFSIHANQKPGKQSMSKRMSGKPKSDGATASYAR